MRKNWSRATIKLTVNTVENQAGNPGSGRLRLGTCGWTQEEWADSFYPPSLPPSRWLPHYAGQFNMVEVDQTSFGIPPRSRVATWEEQAPRGFEFALKVPRTITHSKSLRTTGPDLKDFLRSVSALGEKLGPLLLQFPHAFTPQRLPELLTFLDGLPRRDFRFVVEVRNHMWMKSDLTERLRDRDLPLCWMDHSALPRFTSLTGHLIYIRFTARHEEEAESASGMLDKSEDLDWWATEAAGWLDRNFPVYCVFENEFNGHAPTAANDFAQRLRQRGSLPG